eukprot:627112-Amphidinium_carterae.1
MDSKRQFDHGDDPSNYEKNVLLRPMVSLVELPDRVREILDSEPIIGVWEPSGQFFKLLAAQCGGMQVG